MPILQLVAISRDSAVEHVCRPVVLRFPPRRTPVLLSCRQKLANARSLRLVPRFRVGHRRAHLCPAHRHVHSGTKIRVSYVGLCLRGCPVGDSRSLFRQIRATASPPRSLFSSSQIRPSNSSGFRIKSHNKGTFCAQDGNDANIHGDLELSFLGFCFLTGLLGASFGAGFGTMVFCGSISVGFILLS